MQQTALNEPVLYVSLSVILLGFGLFIGSILYSVLPILIVAVPLGMLIAKVAKTELSSGKKWFYRLTWIFLIFGAFSFVFGYKEIGVSCMFGLIISVCALYSGRKISYKNTRRK